MKNNKELIADIKTKLQFCTTISIFLVGVLQYFFNIYEKTSLDKILSFIIVPVSYLLSYVLLDVRKNKLGEKFLRYINILIITGIFSFIFPLINFAVGKNNLHGFLSIILFQTSVIIIVLIPTIIFISLCVHLVIKKLKNWRENFIK